MLRLDYALAGFGLLAVCKGRRELQQVHKTLARHRMHTGMIT